MPRFKRRAPEIWPQRSTCARAFAFVTPVWVKSPVHALAVVVVLLLALAAASARPEGFARPADTLVVVSSEEAKSLDPHVTTSASDFRILSQIYHGLVTHQPGSLKYAPGLAERWELSADDRFIDFYLRRNVQFHDGTAFDAEAVRFNFERMLRADHPYHHTGPFPLAFLFDKIRRVEVVASHHVRLHLSEPFAPLLSNLAYPSAYMVSPAAVRRHGKDFGRHGCGTGAFYVAAWNPNRALVLKRHAQLDSGLLRSIVYRPIGDPMTALTELHAGGADLLSEVPTDAVARLRRNPEFTTIETQGAHLWFLILNIRSAALRDVRVRRALNHAINREHLVRHVLQDTALPAKGLIADVFLDQDRRGKDPYPFDPEHARALLADAGVALPLPLHLVVPTSGSGMLEPELMATALQADLRAVGVHVTITTMEWNAYLASVNAGLAPDVHMAAMAWMTNDPDTLPALTLRSDAQPPKGFNSGWYANDRVDALVEAARRSMDPSRRRALYRQLDALVVEEAPFLFVASYKQNLALRSRFSGVRLSPSFLLDLTEARVH